VPTDCERDTMEDLIFNDISWLQSLTARKPIAKEVSATLPAAGRPPA